MEYSLTLGGIETNLRSDVLILILMEYSLTDDNNKPNTEEPTVLILILMEYSLTVFNEEKMAMMKES